MNFFNIVKVGDKYNLKGFGRITVKSFNGEMVVVSGSGLNLTIKKKTKMIIIISTMFLDIFCKKVDFFFNFKKLS